MLHSCAETSRQCFLVAQADKRSNENYLKSPECTLIASPYAYILFAGNVAKGLTLPLSISTANSADREGKTSMATERARSNRRHIHGGAKSRAWALRSFTVDHQHWVGIADPLRNLACIRSLVSGRKNRRRRTIVWSVGEGAGHETWKLSTSFTSNPEIQRHWVRLKGVLDLHVCDANRQAGTESRRRGALPLAQS